MFLLSSHEGLLEQGGVYASMWQQQLENRNSNDNNGSNGEGNEPSSDFEPNGMPIVPGPGQGH